MGGKAAGNGNSLFFFSHFAFWRNQQKKLFLLPSFSKNYWLISLTEQKGPFIQKLKKVLERNIFFFFFFFFSLVQNCLGTGRSRNESRCKNRAGGRRNLFFLSVDTKERERKRREALQKKGSRESARRTFSFYIFFLDRSTQNLGDSCQPEKERRRRIKYCNFLIFRKKYCWPNSVWRKKSPCCFKIF